MSHPEQSSRYDEATHRVAQAFHERYEWWAPHFGYKTRDASAVPWEDVPEQNKMVMLATIQSLLDVGVIRHGGQS